MPVEGEWLVVDADGMVGRFFTWDLGPLLDSGARDISIHEPSELSSRFSERSLTDPEEPPAPPWFEYLDDDHEQVFERKARGHLTWDDLPASLRDSVEALHIPHRFAEHPTFDLGQLVSLPDAPQRSAHWSVAWLERTDTLDARVERWPTHAQPFASDGHPIEVSVDGEHVLRVRADEFGVSLEFLDSERGEPRGCARGPRGWRAKFAVDQTPDDALQEAWLHWLAGTEPCPVEPSAHADEPSSVDEPDATAQELAPDLLALVQELGLADDSSPVDAQAALPEEPPAGVADTADTASDDAFYHWLWEQWSHPGARSQPDHDRRPLTDLLRRAFTALTTDEQLLLQAQRLRETEEGAPTVAQALGWSGRRVMDTYKSAKAKLRDAVARHGKT